MTLLVIAGVVLAIGYFLSIRWHPHMRCRSCLDTPGRHWGAIFTHSFRVCHKCNGRGRRQRFGARLFGYGEPQYTVPRVRRTSNFPPP